MEPMDCAAFFRLGRLPWQVGLVPCARDLSDGRLQQGGTRPFRKTAAAANALIAVQAVSSTIQPCFCKQYSALFQDVIVVDDSPFFLIQLICPSLILFLAPLTWLPPPSKDLAQLWRVPLL